MAEKKKTASSAGTKKKNTNNTNKKTNTNSKAKTDKNNKKVEKQSVIEEIKYVGNESKMPKSYEDKQQFYAICFIGIGILLCCFAFIPGIKVWASIRGALFALFGIGYYLLTALMFAFGILAATNKIFKSPASFVCLSLSLTTLFSGIVHICVNSVVLGGTSEWWSQLKEAASIGWHVSSEGIHMTGGILGGAVGGMFLQGFGKEGAVATLSILTIANIMFLTGLTLNIIGKSIGEVFLKIKEKSEERKAIREQEREEIARRREEERLRKEEEAEIISKAMKAEQETFNSPEIHDEIKSEPKVNIDIPFETKSVEEIFKSVKTENETKAEKDQLLNFDEVVDLSDNDNPIASSSNPSFRFTNPSTFENKDEVTNPFIHVKEQPAKSKEENTVFHGEQLAFADDEAEKIVEKANKEANDKQLENMESVKSFKDSKDKKKVEYQLPPITCLNQPKFKSGDDFTGEMRTTSQKLVDTLKSFGVETNLVGVCRGPSVTRYELQPAPGVKISKITNLSDDIALSLAASGVRIEAPIPNKSAVGIEVPNKTKSMVTLREIIASPEFQNAKSKLNVALGKDITGNVTCADLAKMPHLLIAGTTGSGKSVCLNGMIASILYNATPSEVKLLMIDPKQVEFSVYNGIPHLLVPVISNVRKAAGALAWAVTEMENRYKAFSECGVRDIAGFNKYCADHPELKFMPQIVIFIDELNDLMMISPKEVEDSICRLAQKARAAGMHLVVATQRPSVDVITGIIKANIPSRISLSVSSQVDSRTILDMIGAEKLLGNGDMLYNPVGNSKPTRIQGAYLSEEEILRIVDFIKSQVETDYDDEIMEEIERQATAEKKKGSAVEESDGEERDEMLESAVEVVVELGQASTTLLQRKLRLGYARAARIMDQLETSGIVGPSEGSKPRKVLITKAQLLEMKAYADNVNESDE